MAHQYQYQQYQQLQRQKQPQHGGSGQPQQFVAELEAHHPGPPLMSAGNAQLIFEMPGESVVAAAPSKEEQARPVLASDAPVQANPWPFYLDDARHSQNEVAPRQDSGPPAASTKTGSPQANPWPYHGPAREDDGQVSGDMAAAARTNETAPLRDTNRPYPEADLGAEARSNSVTAVPTDETAPVEDRSTSPGVNERSGSISPAKLYPAPLRLSRTPQPPPLPPAFKAYSPGTPEQDQPLLSPLTSSPPAKDTVAMPYRPYRPASASPPEGSPGVMTAPHVTEQIAGGSPVVPYPLDDEPCQFPQLPKVHKGPPRDPSRQSSLPSATPVHRRSTQPSPNAAGTPMSSSDPNLQRHHSLSTYPTAQSPHSAHSISPLASPMGPSQSGSLHQRPLSSAGSHHGGLPSPHASPAHHPLGYTDIAQATTGASHPPVAHSPPPMHHPQPLGAYPPLSPGSAALRPYGSPQSPVLGQTQSPSPLSYVHQQPQAAQRPAEHAQNPAAASLNGPLRPTSANAGAGLRPHSQQHVQHQQQLSPSPPPPPPPPPRPQIQHVTTDPISPTHLQTQSPPPAYSSGVHRTNSQPTPVAYASNQHLPPQSPAPNGTHTVPVTYAPAPHIPYASVPQSPYSPVPQGPHFTQPHPQPQGQGQPLPYGTPQPQTRPQPSYNPSQPYPPQQQYAAPYHPQYPPQPQYVASYQPPLPPRPTTATASSTPVGFGQGVPNVANFPRPPKTQYAPPSHASQKPSSTMKLFSGSSAKRWLDKTNQVLENALAPVLQTDSRPRAGPTQTPIYPFQAAPAHGQNYYPYAIRGDPANQGPPMGNQGQQGR